MLKSKNQDRRMEYDYKYLGIRRPDINNVKPQEVDDCFRVLRETFTNEWLETNGNNVLQKLWSRRDTLATRELFSLGSAIKTLLAFPDFIKEKVELVKTGDPKNWNGALFEIYALSFFTRYKIAPAKKNQAGYDGVLNLSDSKRIRISIKNYSISKHHESFLKEANLINDLTQKYLQDFNSPPIELIISKKTNYPSSGDWQQLKENFHGVFIEYNKIGNNFIRVEIGDWSIIVQRLGKKSEVYSKIKKSYSLILSSQFHTNEEKNLFDKLEEACANIVKHGGNETIDEKNLIVIHLPKIASRENCQKWVKDYFEQYPEKPISGVILYQPLVVSNKDGNGTYISNGVSIICREKFIKDFESFFPLDLTFPIGKPEGVFPQPKIFIQETATTAFEIVMNNSYVFQQGHHFYDAQAKGEAIEGTINKVASGIFTHSIFEIMGQHIEISGQFEPVDELDIM